MNDFIVVAQLQHLKVYSGQQNELAITTLAVQCIYMQVILDKSNLIRLCSEKTIFKLFILESTENQLLGYLTFFNLPRPAATATAATAATATA